MTAMQTAPLRQSGREARRSARERVIRRVQLVADGRSMDGVMLDVSEHGARLQLSQPGYMPAIFMLRRHDGTAIQVVQRWAINGRMGVEFVNDMKPVVAAGRHDLERIRDGLQAAREALVVLGRAEHFGDEEVRAAGRDLGASVDRMARALDRMPRKYAGE